MGGCSAQNCSNHSRKKCRMFKFPKDPDRRRRWIINCRRDGWIPGNSSELCSGHFEESQFETKRADNWKKLKPNAIPTLFDVPNPPAAFAFKHDKQEEYSKPRSVLGHHLVDDTIDTIAERPDTLLERITYLESENKTLKLELESKNRIISFLCDKKIIFSGKPSADPQHPDYAPSLFSFKEDAVKIGQKLLKRYEKNLKRSKNEKSLKNSCEAKPDTQLLDYKPSIINSNQQSSLLQSERNMESSENEKFLRTDCKGKPLADPQHPDYEPSIATSNEQRSLLRSNRIVKSLKKDESFKIQGKPPTNPQHPDCVPSICTFKHPRSLLRYEKSMNCSKKEESIKNSYKETSCEANCSFEPAVPNMDIDDSPVDSNPEQKRDVATMTEITMQHVSQMGEANMDLRKKIIILENTLQQLKFLNNHS